MKKEQYFETSSNLKNHQKIWLCDEHSEEREESDQWLDKLCKELTIWIIRSYEKIMGRQAIKLGESERAEIAALITQNKEALR